MPGSGSLKKLLQQTDEMCQMRDNHSSNECKQPKGVQLECANCRGPHTANYRGCPVFKAKAATSKITAVDRIKHPQPSIVFGANNIGNLINSYAEVTRGQRRRGVSTSAASVQTVPVQIATTKNAQSDAVLPPGDSKCTQSFDALPNTINEIQNSLRSTEKNQSNFKKSFDDLTRRVSTLENKSEGQS